MSTYFKDIKNGQQFTHFDKKYTKILTVVLNGIKHVAVNDDGYLVSDYRFPDNEAVNNSKVLKLKDLKPGQKWRFASNPNDTTYWYTVVNGAVVAPYGDKDSTWVINKYFVVHEMKIDNGNPAVVLVD